MMKSPFVSLRLTTLLAQGGITPCYIANFDSTTTTLYALAIKLSDGFTAGTWLFRDGLQLFSYQARIDLLVALSHRLC
jgi:hypothetical protein